MTGRKGRSGGARPGAGRRSHLQRLADTNPAIALDCIVGLYEKAMSGSASAQIAFLRAAGHFRKSKEPQETQ